MLADAFACEHALAVDSDGDADRDGDTNLAELRAGTNPYDPQSSQKLSLRPARLTWRSGEDLVLHSDGRPGLAAVAFAASRAAAPKRLPGIAGEFRLGTVVGTLIPAVVPGAVTLSVPAVARSFLLFAQPIFARLGGAGFELGNAEGVWITP
jgi:hypothetical protein